jgi:hypothetical protein
LPKDKASVKDVRENYLTPKQEEKDDEIGKNEIEAKNIPKINEIFLDDDISLPLLSPNQRSEMMNYGLSFNSKKVAMGPSFFNVRIMCDCLGKAIKRHIDFS